PGASETLSFEKLLRNKPEDEDIQLEMTRDALSELGVDLSIVGVEIETYTTTYGVWAVDLGASEAYRRSLEKGGHLTGLSTEGRGLKGVTGVKHVRDTYFVVSAIDGRAWSQQAISDLGEDELYDMLDGDLSFRHTDPLSKRTDSFPLERIDVEKEFYIARLTVGVSVATADFLPDSINGEENWYRSGPVGFDLGCSYRADRKSRKVTISGPAYEPDCYRPW
ncbi:MAG: hypothetical protein JW742_00670, partial [Candidatus Aminicenantes bacterium]|nr:hypothetical protein [Candidatus Aminicenantes bacterium]